MDSTEPSPLSSFKSKKILHSSTLSPSVKNPQSQTLPGPDPSPWSSKTPEKSDPPRRTRNCAAALSLKEVRLEAKKLQGPGSSQKSRPDPLMSAQPANERILSSSESSATKVNIPDSSIKLPEKYDILDKFFSSLDSSIRLLRMKGSNTTFMNISPKIECLTDRRFTYRHLAQLKFILPEAIEIRKIMIHDERTSCMKPDLCIDLHVNAVEKKEKKKSETCNLQLRNVFHSRLLDFFENHPEGDEVPEEALPEPFNQPKTVLGTNLQRTSGASMIVETPTLALSECQPIAASHLPGSFTRHFSRKVTSYDDGQRKQQEQVVSDHASSLVSESDFAQKNLDQKNCTKASSKPLSIAESSSNRASLAGWPLSPPPATPVKDVNSCGDVDCPPKEISVIKGTPLGSASTPVKLMSGTPVLQPPKRCYMSPDDDLTQLPSKLARRPPRSLKFDNPDDDADEVGCSAVDSDILDVLPDNLIESIREKESKAILEQDPAISQAKWRKQMLASLPKMFDMIYFLFQSIRRSVITKEELMHKLISNQLQILDRREVEEQLRLLQELVPEWIHEKSSSSGDSLLCVNKISSPEILRTRLAEAK